MAMNRGMGRSWFSTVKKKLFTRTKSPHTKNIIIIHNNTSITGNDEDNRNSCVDAKKDDAVESTPAAAAHTAPNNDYLQKPDEADVDHEAAAPPVDTDEGNGEVEEAEEKDEEVEDSSEEERFNAAIRIQSVFRGHLARRAFSALRSLVKLQAVVRGVGVRKQAWIALRCMHALARLQVRVRARQLLSNESTSQDCGDPVQV